MTSPDNTQNDISNTPMYMKAFNWAWNAGYLAGFRAGQLARYHNHD